MNMEERRIAGKGLYYLFLGQILPLLAQLLVVIPIIGILALFAVAAFSLYGFYTLSKANEGYKTAFLLMIGNLAVQFVSVYFASGIGFFATACDFVTMFLNAMVIYYVCNTTSALLQGCDSVVADMGQKVWKGVILFTAIDMVCIVLSQVPLIGMLALVISVVVWIAQLIVSILYIIFLWKSQKALRGM